MGQYISIVIATVLAVCLFSCTPDQDKNGEQNQQAVEAQTPLDSLSALIEENPESPQLLYERAKLYLQNKSYNSAKSDISKAIRLDSTQSDYYLVLADSYFFTNEPKKCMAALKKSVRLNPENKEAYMKLSEFFLYLRRYEEAVKYANQLLEIDPDFAKAHFLKGMCYKEVEDTARAIDNFQTAVERDPDFFPAYMQLGILYAAKNSPLAESYYQNALNVKPESTEAYYGLAMYYQESNELNKALKTYNTLLQIDPNHKNAHFNLGYINYEHLKIYDQALRHFNDAVEAAPNYYQAVYMRGLCYEAMGDIKRAKAEYTKALKINPEYDKALKGMNRVLDK